MKNRNSRQKKTGEPKQKQTAKSRQKQTGKAKQNGTGKPSQKKAQKNEKATKALGKCPTKKERIAELREWAFAREGRNAVIARAILKELDQPLRVRESDRAMGRRLGVDHRTIGRWRERITGQPQRKANLVAASFWACARR